MKSSAQWVEAETEVDQGPAVAGCRRESSA